MARDPRELATWVGGYEVDLLEAFAPVVVRRVHAVLQLVLALAPQQRAAQLQLQRKLTRRPPRC